MGKTKKTSRNFGRLKARALALITIGKEGEHRTRGGLEWDGVHQVYVLEIFYNHFLFHIKCTPHKGQFFR
jgi:hypothetical protein